MQNDAGTRSDQWHKSDTGCSQDVPPEKESPGALAGASGADYQDWLSWFDDSLNRESAARELLNAVLACDRRDRIPLMERFIDAMRCGAPIPTIGSIMAEARDWAAWACRAELKAYCLASFEAMNPRDQAAFLGHLDRRAAA